MTKKVFFPVVSKLNVPLNVVVILAVVIALLVPAAGYVASAQQVDHPWREVRTLEMEEYGLSGVEGMAFSPDANTFLLVQERGSLAGIGMLEEPVDTTGLQLPVGNPQTMAYNGRTNKLFVLSNDNTELAEVSMNSAGLPSGVAREYRLDAVNLQAALSITFDPTSGKMYVLHADGDQMVIITPDANGSYEAAPGRVSRVNLRSLGAVDLQSIAFNPQTGNIYLLDAGDQRMYEITVSGSKVNEFDLGELGVTNPKSMSFVPSVDQTDEPDNQNLVILHEASGSAAGDRMVELALAGPADLPNGTTVLPATLIRTQDLSDNAWDPSSPDTSGIDYWAAEGKFLIVDSEVEEMSQYWEGYNVFSGTLAGVQGSSCTTHTPSGGASWNHYSPEPTGLAINPNTNRIYIASDSGAKLFEINLGTDGEYCTSDDIVTTNTFSGVDVEDVAYGNNTLFIGGGVNAEIYWFTLGANQVVGGGDDGPINNFDTARWGFTDIEGIGYHSEHNTILISGSHGGDQAYIAEVSTANGGTLLVAYNVEPFMTDNNDLHSDIAYAPSSVNPSVNVVYIVSRGEDNGADPNENDGKWWEINIGNTVIPTPTNAPATSTRTPTATVTATGTVATSTPTATATATATSTGVVATPTDPTAAIFSDVQAGYWAKSFIETLYQSGITGGCATGPLRYCPTASVTRAEMAVFLLRGIHGASYNPPAVGGSTGFTDVPTSHWAAAWIKQLAAEGITGGCGAGVYCPNATVSRDQMAVFLLRAKHGSGYNPPSVGGSTGFTDVPTSYWAAAWIKQLVAEGIASGCGANTYCPSQSVTRDQMTVFLVRTFNLP